METPLQELIDSIKEFRDNESSPLVISRLNQVLLKAASMLHKEQDVIANAYLDGFVNSDATELKVSLIDYYNETFNKEQ